MEEEKYWMLLERLHPGVMLATLEDDEEATHIAAEVMKKDLETYAAYGVASLLADPADLSPAAYPNGHTSCRTP